MEQLVVEVPEGLVKELETYKGNLGEALGLGLRQMKRSWRDPNILYI